MMISRGKELPAIANELHMPLDAVMNSIQNIERKTLSKTWKDLAELGRSFALDEAGNNAQGMQEIIDFYRDLDQSRAEHDSIDYFDYE